MLTLFPDEQIVSSSDGDKVVLTTHRICYENNEGGSYNQSIMLEHITSCEYKSVKIYGLLIIAGLLLVSDFLFVRDWDFFLYVIKEFTTQRYIAFGLAILFWFTRYALIVVGSPSTKMFINVKGMNSDTVLLFINKIEQTKQKRVLSLNQKN
jgi:hypothetical protein